MSEATTRKHIFNAEAKIIEGHLRQPLTQQIQPQAHTQLPAEGGYRYCHSRDFRIEGVLSYESAYSHVSGCKSLKSGGGWETLSTTVIQGLNILEILTADRVVGQIITEHPLIGHVPTISFLGTRFENLRIAGEPVELDLDVDILGQKPENDAPYSKDGEVLSRIENQYKRISGSSDLPAEMAGHYNQLASSLESTEKVECSLVNQAAGAYSGKTHGHIIRIPHFGTVTLGKVKVTHSQFAAGTPQQTLVELTMIDLKLGCAIEMDGPIGGGSNNGGSGGGGTGGGGD
jgi:hypothetical protein